MYKHVLLIAGIGLSQIISGCAIHSTAKDWNALSGVDGITSILPNYDQGWLEPSGGNSLDRRHES